PSNGFGNHEVVVFSDISKPYIPIILFFKQILAAENGRKNGTGLHFWEVLGVRDGRRRCSICMQSGCK
ncbi:hypothetical protein, partial [Klebsiella pneumoniae]|uniref:hypothetical protein n=1 Tax=Klebsiella pneumoniae TaxID=573 RepID=UPI001C7E161C